MSYDTTKVDVSGTTYDAADTNTVWAEDWNAFVAAFKTHAARHKTGAADAIKLDELASATDNSLLNVSIAAHGLCPKLPNDITKFLRGDGTWVAPAASGGDVAGPAGATTDHIVTFDGATGKLIKDSGISIVHHAQHENGGADELSVAGLSGLLADSQTPLAHNQGASTITSGTLDGDRLPAMSTTKKGAVPATGTPSNKVLRDDSTWVTVGTIGGTSGDTDNAVIRANSTGGITVQGSAVTIDDNGSVNIPAGQNYKINNTQIAVANVTGAAPLASPTFTGTPVLPTGTTGVTQAAAIDNTTLATTAFVKQASVIDHGLLLGLTDDDHVRYFDKSAAKAMTGSPICRNVDNDRLSICGGTNAAGHGSMLRVRGCDIPGYNARMSFYTPNAAKDTDTEVMYLTGDTDTPVLNMASHQIKSVLDPTAAQDAATKNYVDGKFPEWIAWIPTLVWTTGNPGSPGVDARYVKYGKVVFFSVYIVSTDSNGCTNLTISLPLDAGSSLVTMVPFISFERYGTALASIADAFAYVNSSDTSHIQFLGFHAGTDGQSIEIFVSGTYETD